jgi:hypothetical protein
VKTSPAFVLYAGFLPQALLQQRAISRLKDAIPNSAFQAAWPILILCEWHERKALDYAAKSKHYAGRRFDINF